MRQFIPVLLLLPMLCFSETSDIVTLTDTNGLAVTGKLISYTPKTDLIKIREESKLTSLSFSALTEESCRRILLWKSDKNFLSRSNLDASFRQGSTHSVSNISGTVTDIITNKKTEQTIGHETRQFCTYKIKIGNESDTPFENLIADYRVFFTQQLTEEEIGKYQLAGSEAFEKLDAGRSWGFSTTSFLYAIEYRSAVGINWTEMPRSTGANIQGVWLRIRKRSLDGEWIEREIEHGDVPRNRERTDYQKVYK